MVKDLLQFKWLKGRRTKALAFIIIFVLGGLKAANVIDESLFTQLVALSTGAGLLTAADHDRE